MKRRNHCSVGSLPRRTRKKRVEEKKESHHHARGDSELNNDFVFGNAELEVGDRYMRTSAYDSVIAI